MRSLGLTLCFLSAACGSSEAHKSGTSSHASSGSGAGGSGGTGGGNVVCGAAADAWTSAGVTDTGRYAIGAVQLADGSFLFAGGWDASKHAQKTSFGLAADGGITLHGSLSRARNFIAVAPLADGFLFTGGFNDSLGSVADTDLYTTATDSFAPTGKLNQTRELFTTTALPDGRVVAIGGLSAIGLTVRDSAEIYDPAKGQWTLSGNLVEPRFGQAALWIPEAQKVLIGGGKTTGPMGDVFRSTLEWFDPATGMFTLAGTLAEARDRPTANRLSDGRVLFVGGANATSQTLTSTEIFDPTSGSISAGSSLNTRRMAHASAVLGDGSIIVAGGWSDATTPSESSTTVERFDEATSTWESLPPLAEPRHDFALVADSACELIALGGLHAKTNSPSVTPIAIERLTFTVEHQLP